MREESSPHSDIFDRMVKAREKTWQAVFEIAGQIEVGMTEAAAEKIAQKTLVKLGCRKFWHPCHVRFGAGTLLSFKDPPSPHNFQDDDLYYVDIGPIWDGIEGDAGQTFYRGARSDKKRFVEGAKDLFVLPGINGRRKD